MQKPAAVPLVYIPIQSVVIGLSRLTETYNVTGHTNFVDVRLAQTSYFNLNNSGAKAIHTDAAVSALYRYSDWRKLNCAVRMNVNKCKTIECLGCTCVIVSTTQQ
jgi:hypothetical protein